MYIQVTTLTSFTRCCCCCCCCIDNTPLPSSWCINSGNSSTHSHSLAVSLVAHSHPFVPCNTTCHYRHHHHHHLLPAIPIKYLPSRVFSIWISSIHNLPSVSRYLLLSCSLLFSRSNHHHHHHCSSVLDHFTIRLQHSVDGLVDSSQDSQHWLFPRHSSKTSTTVMASAQRKHLSPLSPLKRKALGNIGNFNNLNNIVHSIPNSKGMLSADSFHPLFGATQNWPSVIRFYFAVKVYITCLDKTKIDHIRREWWEFCP